MYTIKIQRVGQTGPLVCGFVPGTSMEWAKPEVHCWADMKNECFKKIKITIPLKLERKHLTKILLISLIEELGKCNNQFKERLWGAVLRVEP